MDEDNKIEEKNYKLPEEKVEDLKDALREVVYKVEETEDGEIKVTN